MSSLIQPQNHGKEKIPYIYMGLKLELRGELSCCNTDNCSYIYNDILKRKG